MKNKILLNPEPDGTCRTIKANYHKVSAANFVRRGGYGASAVIEWEMDAAVPRHGEPMRRLIMQKVGDRDKDMVSVKGIAFCVNANPMSDRQQMVIEYEPVQVDDSAGDGPGLCDVPAEVGVRPELS